MGMARFSRLLPCCLDGGASNARCRGPWMGMTRGASAGAAAGEALAWSGKQAKAPNTRIGRPLRPAIARAQRSWGGLGADTDASTQDAGRRTQDAEQKTCAGNASDGAEQQKNLECAECLEARRQFTCSGRQGQAQLASSFSIGVPGTASCVAMCG